MTSNASKKLIELFYDVVSPYSWFAFEVLCRYKNKWAIDLSLKPVFLGGIMQKAGNKPPVMVCTNKAIYLPKDVERMSEYMKVDFKLPSDIFGVMFDKGTLKAQRFITAVDMIDSSFTENVSRILWTRIHRNDEDITEPENFVMVGKQAGMKPEILKKAISQITDDAVKKRLADYTEEALEKGAFGLPTIVAHVNGKQEMIFGCDRFPILAKILGEKWDGPIPQILQNKL